MKVVLQDGSKDCGICCLLSIIKYYKGDVSKEYLREITNTTKEGVSFYDLINGAKKLGFEAIGMNGKIDNINVNNLPCIVHFIVNKRYKHFVVLYKIYEKKHQVELMDPAKGKKIISISEFNLLTSNNYIFLKPIKKLPVMTKKKIIKKNIQNLFKTKRKLLLLITYLTINFFILNVFTSFHFKYLLEYSINNNLSISIKNISYLLIIVYILKNINLFLRNILLNKWMLIFDDETTNLTYKQILLLPYLYYKNRTTGEIVSRFKDLNTIRIFISNMFTVITTDLISMIIFLIIMLRYSSKITIIIVLLFLFIIIISFLFQKQKKKNIQILKKREDQINSYIIQGINNVDTIKGTHLEKRLIDKFLLAYNNFLTSIYKYQTIEENYNLIKNNIQDLILIFLYGIGCYYVIKGKIVLSNLIIFHSCYSYFQNSLLKVMYLIEEYPSYKICLERIEELFMLEKENFSNNYFYLPYTLSGRIEIKNLSYKIGTKYLLNNINLSIEKGEKILIIGASGSGKSTFMKMLLRYIEVESNTISIAGIDINHYHLENIRKGITYVTNNEYLFTDTIRNNILLYQEKTEEELIKACQISLVDEILTNKYLGYDSLIEENGFNFSNGERQRIILARSILKDSSIYILDEALGNIDVQKEKKILENLFTYLKEKTIIVISHRHNNKKLFDRILKLEKGKLYETEKV